MHNLTSIMYTSNCYRNPVSRVCFYIKTLELTSWSRSYFSNHMVFITSSVINGAWEPKLAPRRSFESGAYLVIFGKGAVLNRPFMVYGWIREHKTSSGGVRHRLWLKGDHWKQVNAESVNFIVILHELAKVLTNARTNEGVTLAFSVRFKRIVHFTSNSLKSDKSDP